MVDNGNYLTSIVNKDTIKINQDGIYLLMVRLTGNVTANYIYLTMTTGCSNVNNGYAELLMNGNSVGQCYCNNSSGLSDSIYFYEIISIKSSSLLQIKNVNLTHHAIGQIISPLSTQFTLVLLNNKLSTNSYARFSSLSPWCSGGNGYWYWQLEEGDSNLFQVTGQNCVTVNEEGNYILVARVTGNATSNGGYCELHINGSMLSRYYKNGSDGHHNNIHLNRTIYLTAKSFIQIKNNTLTHSYNLGQKLAIHLSLYKLP